MSKTVKMLALKQHTVDNIVRKKGEQYEVVVDETSPRDVVGTLIAVGFAKVLDPPIETKVEEAEPSPKGAYERRDMRARR